MVLAAAALPGRSPWALSLSAQYLFNSPSISAFRSFVVAADMASMYASIAIPPSLTPSSSSYPRPVSAGNTFLMLQLPSWLGW